MSQYSLTNRMSEMVLTPPSRFINPYQQDQNRNRRDFEGAIPRFDTVILDQILKEKFLRSIVTRCRQNDDLAIREHYRQYMPYILAEVQASVNERVNSLESGSRILKSPVLMKRERDDVERVGLFISFRLEISSKDLPRLDHGFYNELVVLMPPDQGNETPLYFAVARLARGQRDDVDEVDSDDDESNSDAPPPPPRLLQLRVTMRQEDYNDLCRSGATEIRLEMCHIQGLIPAERQYNACRDPPLGAHAARQIASATLPPWPDAAINNSATPAAHLSALNESQRRCVERLAAPVEGETDDDLSSSVSMDGRPQSGLFLLQGPPGTGKTTTTAALIAELALRYRDCSLLICAPSNQALRELLVRVNELFTRHPPEEVPPMALVGVAKKLPPALDNVYAHKFASRLFKPLIDLKRQLRNLLRRRHNEVLIVRAIRKHCTAVVLPRMDGLVVGHNAFSVRRHVLKEVQKLRLEVNAAVAAVITEADGVLAEAEAEAEAEADGLVTATETLIALLQNGAKHCELFVVQRAQIVFATLVGSGRPWLQKQRESFDVVVVDEAGQALVPEVVIPMHFAPRLMVQVGDPQQLAPVVQAVSPTHLFGQSMMQQLMVEQSQPFERLHVQYRMHPAICDWVSDTFYDGALVTDASVSARPSLRAQFPRLDTRLDAPSLFVDVSRGAEARGEGHSWRNEEEARLVVDTLLYLLRHCAVPAGSVGVVSFYASQVALLKSLLTTRLQHELRGGRITRDQRRDWARVTVHTVDGFQGGERAITLVSCVRSTAAVGFLSNARRLNVAMSRAQSARWVFGHGAGLRGAADTVLPSFLAVHRSPLPAETLAAVIHGPTAASGGGIAVAAPARVLRRSA